MTGLMGFGAVVKRHHAARRCHRQPVTSHTGPMGTFYSGPRKNNYCKVLKPNGTLLPRQTHVSENVCSSLKSLKNIVLFLAALSPPAHPPSSSPPKEALSKQCLLTLFIQNSHLLLQLGDEHDSRSSAWLCWWFCVSAVLKTASAKILRF